MSNTYIYIYIYNVRVRHPQDKIKDWVGHRSVRKGFVGFRTLSDQTDRTTGQLLRFLVPKTVERKKDPSGPPRRKFGVRSNINRVWTNLNLVGGP